MKPNLIFCIVLGSFIACSNNKAAEEKTASNPEQEAEIAANKETDQSPGDDIVGYWKLTLEAYDDNENKSLDEEERKKGIRNRYTFRFNTDGSCRIQETFKGRYEVKTENNNKILYVYRNRIEGEEDKDPAPDVYRIITMSKDQLVLLEREGNLTFWVFEKAS